MAIALTSWIDNQINKEEAGKEHRDQVQQEQEQEGKTEESGEGRKPQGNRTTFNRLYTNKDYSYCTTLELFLEMDSSWPIQCCAEIHVGLGLHYPSQ